jgi:lactate dehydrogenase-like 2-hydroxyacid dehydrogenase
MKIVFLDSATMGDDFDLSPLFSMGDVEVYTLTSPHEVLNRTIDADIVITNKVVFNSQLLSQLPRLKLICLAATGMNNIDLEATTQKGIVVKNVSGYSTETVTQQTFASLFYLMNHSGYYDEYVKSGKYCYSSTFTHIVSGIHELAGKRFGIIGLGAIGSRVAQVAACFGAEVVYYSTSGKNINSLYKCLSLSELLSSSDIVSIHAPLNVNTKGLLSISSINLMKSSSYLLNMGRGGIVNEKDLALALDQGVIAGAAIDVLEKEPINKENPLLHLKNPQKLFITPHIAWASEEARTRLLEGIINNIKDWIGGFES